VSTVSRRIRTRRLSPHPHAAHNKKGLAGFGEAFRKCSAVMTFYRVQNPTGPPLQDA